MSPNQNADKLRICQAAPPEYMLMKPEHKNNFKAGVPKPKLDKWLMIALRCLDTLLLVLNNQVRS